MSNLNKKFEIVSLIVGVLLACSVLKLPVKAAEEWETAGASIGKEEETLNTVYSKTVEGWVLDSNGWWYRYSDGSYPKLAWREINGVWYYFDNQGYWVDNNIHETGSIKGIDISAWQENINWEAVKKSGIEFAFIRIGHGTHVLDTYYKYNITNANAVGIPVGVYFYSTAKNEDEAVADAQFVIKNITGYTVSYPVVIDLEDVTQEGLSKNALGKIAKAYCDEIRKAGYTPMLYCNENWYNNYIDISLVDDVEKWIARYNVTYSETIPRQVWQCCSKGRVDGIKGNVDINFAYKDYTNYIVPRTEPVSSYHMEKGYWIENQVGKWYCYYDGGYPANAWEKISGIWYWFDAAGYMTTEWQYIGGRWYYFDETGAMQTGWKSLNEQWYYFNGAGAMQSGWLTLPGGRYYLDNTGKMLTGWQTIDGYRYYFEPSGIVCTGVCEIDGIIYEFQDCGGIKLGWVWKNGGWYYVKDDLTYAKEFLILGNNTYYMDKNGLMKTGWQFIDDSWHYFELSGNMRTGWLFLSGTWYYLNSDGKMVTGWQTIQGYRYCFTLSGVMYAGENVIDGKIYEFRDCGGIKLGWNLKNGTWYYIYEDLTYAKGFLKLGNNTYYLDNNGVMKTGWQLINGRWYYFDLSGAMLTGWKYIGIRWYYFEQEEGGMYANKWLDEKYYFQESGAMATGWLNIDGKYYYFLTNGVKACEQWIGNYYVKTDGSMATDERVDNGRYYVDVTGQWVPGR